MNSTNKKEIEKIFITSSSAEELFDVFRASIENKLNDVQLYKILLRNKALSADEISMYADKICKEFPEFCYKIYFAAGQILESNSVYGIYHERAMNFFKKAAKANPTSHEPYLSIAGMYSAELDSPKLKNILKVIKQGIEEVHLKSKVYFALANIYKKLGDEENENLYQRMGEKSQRKLQ